MVARLAEARSDWPTLSPDERPAFLSSFRRLRDEARLYRWYLEVQRESVGLRDHRRLDEDYPRPQSVSR